MPSLEFDEKDEQCALAIALDKWGDSSMYN